MSKILEKTYYSTNGFWKEYSAKTSEDEARKWLQKQALWKIYLPKPKNIPRPQWTISTSNQIQTDLFLPHDTIRR